MGWPKGNPNYIDYEDDETVLPLGGDRVINQLTRKQFCKKAWDEINRKNNNQKLN